VNSANTSAIRVITTAIKAIAMPRDNATRET